MPKFIKKSTARRCPIHQSILEECGKSLAEKGYFNKKTVIDSLNYQAVEESVRWDYLSDFLSDPSGDHSIELVPLAQKFFSSTRAERLRDSEGVDAKGNLLNLGPYLAGGHGKKTAGYASVTFEGGLLALKRAQRFRGQSNGVGRAFNAYREAVLKKTKELDSKVVEKLEKLNAA